MSRTDRYFQFPLRYVTERGQTDNKQQMRDSLRGRCWDFTAWSIIRSHNAEWRAGTVDLDMWHGAANQYLNQQEEAGRVFVSAKGTVAATWQDLSTVKAMNMVVVMQMLQYWYKTERTDEATLISEYDRIMKQAAAGRKPGVLVRLRSDLFHDATGWHVLKTKILCAVYAAIGSDRAKPLHHGFVQALASGFANLRDAAEHPEQLIPEATVRYWLDKLHQAGLYRCCLHNGKRWYTIKSGGEMGTTDLDFARWLKANRRKSEPKPLINTADLPD